MQRKALVVGVSQYSKLRTLESFSNNANAIADILEPTFKVKRLPEAVEGDRVRVGKSGVLAIAYRMSLRSYSLRLIWIRCCFIFRDMVCWGNSFFRGLIWRRRIARVWMMVIVEHLKLKI